jgi:hypothetical protein
MQDVVGVNNLTMSHKNGGYKGDYCRQNVTDSQWLVIVSVVLLIKSQVLQS